MKMRLETRKYECWRFGILQTENNMMLTNHLSPHIYCEPKFVCHQVYRIRAMCLHRHPFISPLFIFSFHLGKKTNSRIIARLWCCGIISDVYNHYCVTIMKPKQEKSLGLIWQTIYACFTDSVLVVLRKENVKSSLRTLHRENCRESIHCLEIFITNNDIGSSKLRRNKKL